MMITSTNLTALTTDTDSTDLLNCPTNSPNCTSRTTPSPPSSPSTTHTTNNQFNITNDQFNPLLAKQLNTTQKPPHNQRPQIPVNLALRLGPSRATPSTKTPSSNKQAQKPHEGKNEISETRFKERRSVRKRALQSRSATPQNKKDIPTNHFQQSYAGSPFLDHHSQLHYPYFPYHQQQNYNPWFENQAQHSRRDNMGSDLMSRQYLLALQDTEDYRLKPEIFTHL